MYCRLYDEIYLEAPMFSKEGTFLKLGGYKLNSSAKQAYSDFTYTELPFNDNIYYHCSKCYH